MFRMTEADFMAEQARMEERRCMLVEGGSLISSEGRSGEDEGRCEQGLIDGIEKTLQSVYTKTSIMALLSNPTPREVITLLYTAAYEILLAAFKILIARYLVLEF